ncbi:hypothetical protein RRF57_004925 [Xylaria bambusicola]|uniref:Uncharacterized protein n=1 Tax=Xylaria bambusicola TaxID=326684 RepID=A0AAN7YXD2_9PEZI
MLVPSMGWPVGDIQAEWGTETLSRRTGHSVGSSALVERLGSGCWHAQEDPVEEIQFEIVEC